MRPTAGVAVSVHALAKRYGAHPAVRDVSFTVAPGEIFGLLGPNGAGKTTTLECVLGLRQPDAGQINIGGRDATRPTAAVKDWLGAQLQSSALQDKVTAREALTLFAGFYSAPAALADLIAVFGLERCVDTRFETLSGGEQRRVALALAFVGNPRLVVLDEPTAGLDPQAKRALHATIARAARDGRTVLLSTHDLDEAESLCHRVAILNRGALVASGAPGELIAQSATTAWLRGSSQDPLPADRIAALPGVVACEGDASAWALRSNRMADTLTALIRLHDDTGNRLLTLNVTPPSLADVFFARTGVAWEDRDRP